MSASRPESAAQAGQPTRGAVVGALYLTLFGGFWAFAAFANGSGASWWMFGAVSVVVVILTSLSVLRLRDAATPPSLETQKRMRRLFRIVVAAECVAIGAAAFLFVRADRP